MLVTTADENKERWCEVVVPTAGRVSLCAPNSTHHGPDATEGHSQHDTVVWYVSLY